MEGTNKSNLIRLALYTLNIIWVALFIAVVIIIPIYLWSEVSWSLPTQDKEWESHANDPFEFDSEEFWAWKNSRPMDMGYRILIQFVSFFVGIFICTVLYSVQGKLLGELGTELVQNNKKPNIIDRFVALSVIGILDDHTLWKDLVNSGEDATIVSDLTDMRAKDSMESIANALVGMGESAVENMEEELDRQIEERDREENRKKQLKQTIKDLDSITYKH